MMEIFGYASEPHGTTFMVSGASIENGLVTCCDLAGFLGCWKMHEGGVFFVREDEAIAHAALMNEKRALNSKAALKAWAADYLASNPQSAEINQKSE